MARHPWVSQSDQAVRFGVQIVIGQTPLREVLATGRLIDHLGYDGLFVFDHPSQQYDPWILLPALATQTERVRLGSVVNCVPYRHPSMLARLSADLDNLSNGRHVLGLGSGWLESEFRALGGPMPPIGQRQAMLSEACRIIRQAWSGDPVTYQGRHYTVEDLTIKPPPAQQPAPPILIGGNGPKVTLRQVAQYADACNVSELGQREGKSDRIGGAATVKRLLETIDQHCRDVGRDPGEILRSHFTLRLIVAPDADTLTTKVAAARERASGSPGTQRAHPTAWVTVTPGEAVAYYQSMVDVGCRYFVVQIDVDDHESIELLAREVMPALNQELVQ